MLPSRKTRLIVGKSGGHGRQIDNLDIEASIERSADATPDRLHVTVYNLSEQTRGLVNQKDSVCQILAGYDSLSLLFSGRVVFASTEQDGPDIVTMIDAADGFDAWSMKHVTVDFPPGTTKRQVVDRMAAASGLSVGILPEIPGAYRDGYSFNGYWRDGMRDCLEGRKYSIHDNVVTFADAKSTRRSVLTPDSGMIGSPRQSRQKDKNQKEYTEVAVSSVLMPGIRMHDTVDIRGKFASGVIKVTNIIHTLGDEWTTTITGRWTT